MSNINDEYKELREIIALNPELPIMFTVDSKCGSPDYAWSIAMAKAKVGIVFFNKEWNEEKVYTDEDVLMEDVEEWVFDNYNELTKDDQEELIKAKIKEFEDQWENTIIIKVTNY